MNLLRLLAGFLIVCVVTAQRPVQAEEPPFQFRDVAEAAGLFPALDKTQGHAAGWGDIDGDGQLDLYLGTFFAAGLKPNVLLRQERGVFQAVDQPSVQIPTRATGALIADLDNDGDADLYVSSMPQPKNQILGCTLFRNDGQGKFVNVSEGNGACPAELGGRSATAFDYDGDGLLDLLVGEDPLAGYNGSKTRSSRLFRNLGELRFEDTTQAAGIPAGIPGLGVAAADLTNDGWPDLFLAAQDGGNRLFINTGRGTFREAEELRTLFSWPGAKGDNMVCGVAFADVNRDGWLDLVLGPHFKTPWITPVAPRLFLNRGVRDGLPQFEEITEQAGLVPLSLKAPHVEVQDFDNDGWPDLAVSIVKFSGSQVTPIIFRNLGVENGLPKFELTGWDLNDFPTAEDRAIGRTGQFFDKMIADSKIAYTAPMPAADYDNDGRVDLFFPSWWADRRALLLKNETPGGHWLQVQVVGPQGTNRMGVGTRVRVYPAGQGGKAASLLAEVEIGLGWGYASSHAPLAHIGLGPHEKVDVVAILPHGGDTIERPGIAADQRVVLDK